MKRWFLRGLAVLLVPLLLWLAVVMTGLLPHISEEQAAAVSDMRSRPQQAIGERNAMELIWSLRHDVPVDHRADLLRADAEALDAWRPADGEQPTSAAEGRYPPREAEDAPELPGCDLDCLDKVRADTAAWRAALTARQSRLEALRGLAEFDHLHTPYRPTLSSPIPAFQHTGELQVAAAALAFVDGDTDAALDGLCRSLGDWRQLKGRSDMLIADMIVLAWQRRGAKLYADIRAELPRDHPLPASCAIAFAPPRVAERSACDVWRTEFQLFDNAFRPEMLDELDGEGPVADWAMRWLLNHEATAAMLAPRFQSICRHAELPLGDWQDNEAELSCGWQQQLFNPVGCWMVNIATPNYRDYLRRDRDGEGILHLLQLADWLAAQSDPGAAFEQRPESLRAFEQPVSFADGELSLQLLQPRKGQDTHFRMALPGARYTPSTEEVPLQ
ncbi:MAG TPA: hypothetical protein VFY12_09965 [Arenimonas sp.]|nr:hypothetical protein [Arenimonas sp.]